MQEYYFWQKTTFNNTIQKPVRNTVRVSGIEIAKNFLEVFNTILLTFFHAYLMTELLKYQGNENPSMALRGQVWFLPKYASC